MVRNLHGNEDIVQFIQSPIKNFEQMWKEENWDLPQLEELSFNWDEMQPKVTYSKEEVILYGVYRYSDGCFYYINEDGVLRVEPSRILIPKNERYYDEQGKIIDDELLFDLYPSDVCGEADDFSCYVYFNAAESKE